MSNEQNRYGDGTVFEGVRSKDSVIHTWRLAIDEVYPGHAVIHGPSFKLDCFLTASELNQNDYEKRTADLRLIAAAPELYAELQNIANADPTKWDEDTRDQFQQWAQNRAKSALAKARGEG